VQVLEVVTAVLQRADGPLRVTAISEAARSLLGEPLRYSTVKGTLSNYTIRGDRRFRRVERGYYELRRP
jgi:hypothetical protein